MKLWEMTWQDVAAVDRASVVVIPTGSLEQHGPHLPLFTDSILVTAVAEAVEQRIPDKIVLTPTLWLGASGHHLAFPGSLSASFETYEGQVQNVVECLIPHGFTKFFVLNGHGGNSEPNGVALRKLKAKYPNLTFGHSGYFAFAVKATQDTLTGPIKEIRHACEAECSLMMAVRPDLVRVEKRRDDGLYPDPPVVGMIHHFDEMTEEGSLGYATLGTPEKGQVLLEAAIDGVTENLVRIHGGYVLVGQAHGN